MHPNPAQGATVDRTATLGDPIADRNATYVADTRARYGHTVHLAREDLGTDGTDADRLERYATAISESRARSASTPIHAIRTGDLTATANARVSCVLLETLHHLEVLLRNAIDDRFEPVDPGAPPRETWLEDPA